MHYKKVGYGNVRNRKAYDAGLDMIKFDMVVTQNPRVSPSDLDCVMERRGFLCIGEVKRVGTPLNKGQTILRDNLRRYHSAWYFFASATEDGLKRLELDCDFIFGTFDVNQGWYDYEMYIVLSAYHQLMYLFASDNTYGNHPRSVGDAAVARITSLFTGYCQQVCDLYAQGETLVLPKSRRGLASHAGYRNVRDIFEIIDRGTTR